MTSTGTSPLTTYYTATTLDGYIADEHDSLDWLLTQPQEAGGPMSYDDFVKDIGALCMGATTYEWILRHQARTGQPWAYDVPSFVFTHRSFEVMAGVDVRFVSGAVGPVHEAMVAAAGSRDLWVVGGGDLAGQFADAGLLDEVWVQYAPVTLGAGAPLLPRQVELRLEDVVRNRDFACARYTVLRPDGPAPGPA